MPCKNVEKKIKIVTIQRYLNIEIYAVFKCDI